LFLQSIVFYKVIYRVSRVKVMRQYVILSALSRTEKGGNNNNKRPQNQDFVGVQITS
jgi:hypothetical protein